MVLLSSLSAFTPEIKIIYEKKKKKNLSFARVPTPTYGRWTPD